MASGRMASNFRRTAPSLARFFERETGARDTAIVVGATSVAATLLVLAPSAEKSAGAWALLALTAAQVALFTCALGLAIRALTFRRLDSSALPLGAALLVVFLVADRVLFGIFRHHADLASFREASEAIRAGALSVDARAIAVCVAAIVAVWLTLVVAQKALAALPKTPHVERAVRGAVVPALLVVATFGSTRSCLFRGSTSTSRVESAVPWGESQSPAVTPASSDRLAMLFSDERVFGLAKTNADAALAGPMTARTRPDLLIVHVESLRADMLRPDVAPAMVALAGESLTSPHHFTTGTNTGTGVFGILNGLLSPYYPLARRDHVQPAPLRVLKRLGYRLSVYFANNFRTYDGLYDLFFAGLADFAYDGLEEPVYAADAKMVDAYITSLAAPQADPRFDYVVLDSTHYDYSYPSDFEKFTPAMTLDLGFKDGIATGDSVDRELEARGPFVKNRYENSVLYADSLVKKIVDALRASNRLERTIVVVTGDHGEEFWEHGVFGHGFFHLSNEQCEVPLVMRIPGGPTTTRYRYTSHADIFPTIFDAMGLATVSFMNGKSLLGYEPSLDVAVSGFGVTGTNFDRRMLVAGDGLEVHWLDVAPFDVTEVANDAGDAVASPQPSRVDDLVARALAAKGLR
jgi:Sulfatase